MIKGSHSASASTYCNFFFFYDYSKHSHTLSLVEQFHILFKSFLLCRTKNFPPYNFHHSFLLLTFVWILKEFSCHQMGSPLGSAALGPRSDCWYRARRTALWTQFPPQSSCHLTSHNLCPYLWDNELIKTSASQPFLLFHFFFLIYILY